MFVLRIVFFFSSIVIATCVYSQKQVTGIVLDSTLHKPVPFAYVYNASHSYLTLSDSTGHFSLPVKVGDTLVISSIGYYWHKHFVNCIDSLEVFLEPQVYVLSEVKKYATLPFHELSQKILSIPFEKDSLHLGITYEKYFPMKEYIPGSLSYSIDGLITAIYSSVNRHARNQIKALELIQNAHTLVQINQKFSKEIVQELTNLPHEYLDEFIMFCSFSDEFLLHTSEYVLYAYMYAKFDEFLIMHPHLQKL